MDKTTAHLAFLALSDIPTGEPPESFLLLKFGENAYTKGGKRGSFVFSKEDAEKVLDDFKERGKDLVVDYDHQSIVEGVQAPAAGWIRALRLTDDGLAADVEWTEKARTALSAREYRYHSPVINFGAEGHPAKLHSVALTNHPALHDYAPLVAHDNQAKEKTMNEHLKKLMESLGLAAAFDDGKDQDKEAFDAIYAKLDAFKADEAEKTAFLEKHGAKTFDDVTGKIAGMVPASEKAELQKKLDAIEGEKAVEKAFSDGKLVEAQREWAKAYAAKDLKAFSDFIAAAPVVVPLSDKPPCAPKKGEGNGEALSDEEREILLNMGINPETVKKENKKEE